MRSPRAALLVALLIASPVLGAVARADDAPMPDLVGMISAPPVVTAGPVQIAWSALNNGSAASGHFDIIILVDGSFADDRWVTDLANGTSVDGITNWTLKPGDHNATIIVDEGGDVNETNESNNVQTIEIHADPSDPRADLVPSLHGPRSVMAEQWVQFDAVITNRGYSWTDGFSVGLYVDGSIVWEESDCCIGPGENVTVPLFWYASPAGHHFLYVAVDLDNDVNESNEANNVAFGGVYVQPIEVDLGIAIASIEHEPIQTDAGNVTVDPVGRHFIDLDLTNAQNDTQYACYQVDASTGFSSQDVEGNCIALAPGVSHLRVEWRPHGVGDVRLRATIRPADVGDYEDIHPDDNSAERDDFLLVGGLGFGLVLP